MNAFAGIVRFDSDPSDGRIEERVCRAVAAPKNERVDVVRSEGALFVQRDVALAGQSKLAIPAATRHRLFVASARLDNRTELAAELQLSVSEASEISDAAILLRLWERWGDTGVARCIGAFAFAEWDPGSRRLTLGRDCLGYRPLFFHRGRDFVAFATTLNILLALPDVPRELDDVQLANYLVLNLNEARRTFYRGVERVPSRTLVTIDPMAVHHRHYWTPKLDVPPPYRREQDYIDRARELFDQAVASAIADTPDVAISTSGGLDSSAIAATAARLGRDTRVDCYSLVAADDTDIDIGPFRYFDDRRKLEALGRIYPELAIHFLAPQGPHRVEEDDTRHFASASSPVLNPTDAGLFSFLYDAVGAGGHQRLLTGLFGNFGLTWSGEFSLLALLRGGQWRAVAHELPVLARKTRRTLARTIAREVVFRAAPNPVRRFIYRLQGLDPDSVARYSALNPDFIAAHDVSASWSSQGFDPWFHFAAQHPVLVRAHFLFDHNQVGRDRVGLKLEQRGYDIRYPHGDRRLLEFMLTVPEPMFRRDGVPRSFARAVLADRLPAEILTERRQGVQDANWFRRLDGRRQALAAEVERLEGSPTARRLIDLPRLKGLLQQWPVDERSAQERMIEFGLMLPRAVHVGNFIRWVEGGNA